MDIVISGPRIQGDTDSTPQAKGLFEILKERSRQVQKWGNQRHPPLMWNAILGEEFGEVSQECVETTFDVHRTRDQLKEELIQTAAVALAWLEDIYAQEDE